LPLAPPPAGFSQTFEDQLLNKKPARGAAESRPLVGAVAAAVPAAPVAAGQGQAAPGAWSRPSRAAGSFLGRNIF
jgi:hypothetical protein